MLFEELFDFSQESNFKAELWEKMEQRMKQAAVVRREVSLDSISPEKKEHRHNDIKPHEVKESEAKNGAAREKAAPRPRF